MEKQKSFDEGFKQGVVKGKDFAKQQLRENIEGKRKKIQIELPDTLHKNIGYNQALDDILDLIKDYPKD